MRPWIKWSLFVMAGATVIHIATMWMLPRAIMAGVVHVTEAEEGTNRFFHEPLATADMRKVVRPSPDIAYSVCLLDVSRGPVRVSAPVSKPYTSIAIYAANTDNVFVQNDQQAEAGHLQVLVTGPDAPETTGAVKLPSNTGLALVRRVVKDHEHFQALAPLRHQASCRAVSDTARREFEPVTELTHGE